MPVAVSPNVVIPDSDLSVTFIRSSGPGGQNVNKVASAVQLRFDLGATAVLDERVKQRLRALAGRRLTEDGAVLIVARNHRTQERNRAEALERLRDLLERALVEPRPRKATRPTRASKTRCIDAKKRHGTSKRLRGRVSWEGGGS
jgi:ribosome-associated protein